MLPIKSGAIDTGDVLVLDWDYASVDLQHLMTWQWFHVDLYNTNGKSYLTICNHWYRCAAPEVTKVAFGTY